MKSQQIWFYVNRNGKVYMSLDEPKKNISLGIYEVKYPYVNCIMYKDICEIVKKVKLTFDQDPQFLEIQLQMK